jgi:hypothetical protein
MEVSYSVVKCSAARLVRVLTVAAIACGMAAVRPAASAGQALGCPGDCNLDATVTVDELVMVVAIAREEMPDDQCVAADANRDGRVRIDDAVRAVRRSMVGCPPLGWCVGLFDCQFLWPPRPDATHEFCCYYSTWTERADRILWCSERDPDNGGCACNDACDGCRFVQRGDPSAPPEIVCDDIVGAGP